MLCICLKVPAKVLGTPCVGICLEIKSGDYRLFLLNLLVQAINCKPSLISAWSTLK